jgi:hypothetical protein
MLAEMGGTHASNTITHTSTAITLGKATPSAVASAAGILAAREAMLGGAIALGESQAAALGAVALQEARANSEHDIAGAREENNKLLSARAHRRAGETVMAWAAPGEVLEEHCLEAEEAGAAVEAFGGLVEAEEATLGALREGLAGARGEWQYLTTLLDARNAAAARAREARARERAAGYESGVSAAAMGASGTTRPWGIHSFVEGLPPPPPGAQLATTGPTSGGGGSLPPSEYAPLLEELCALTSECGGTPAELWGLLREALEPLLVQGAASVAGSGPAHTAPVEAGQALSVSGTLVDLLEEEVGQYRTAVLSTPLPPTPPNPSASNLMLSLDSLRRGNPMGVSEEIFFPSATPLRMEGAPPKASPPPSYVAYLRAL